MCNADYLGLVCDFHEEKIVPYNESNFQQVNRAAQDAADLLDKPTDLDKRRCIGICYAFGNSMSLVVENTDVSK